MQAMILAAAGGPEFGPLTRGVSKGMLPFCGRPLLAHVVRYLERHGASRIHINLNQAPYEIERHFQAEPPERARLQFHLESARLGTAGAARRMAQGAKETLIVCMGDLISEIDLDAAFAFHKAKGALVTLVLVPGDRARMSGRATIDAHGKLTSFEEGVADPARPVNAGIYLIEPEAFLHVPPHGGDLARDFFPDLLAKNLPVFGYYTEAYWADAGHPEGYLQALTDVLAGKTHQIAIDGVEREPGVWVHPLARIHPKAKLLAPCYVGAGITLDQEAQIGPNALAEGPARLRRGAKVAQGAVFPYADVGKATLWKRRLLYADGWVDLTGDHPAIEASDDPEVLGTTYREPLAERWHTLFDQVLAGIGLFAIAPLLLLLTLLIKLDSPGPAFYTQLRVGQDRHPYRRGMPRGSIFEVFKFRTMHVDADAKVEALRAQNQYGNSAFFKLEADPRITRVGHFLRKTSLDELPQLINVLKGEMRLVGNRPLPVYEAEALQEDWMRARFLAPAGITGLWQISGRSELSEKERLALDAYYTVTRTFLSDLGILFRTVPALLMRRGAR